MYVLYGAYNIVLIAKREQNMKDSMAYLVMPETSQGAQRSIQGINDTRLIAEEPQ